MGLETLLDDFFKMADSVCNIIATDKILSAGKQLQQARLDLLAEKQKGADADDAKIESLYGQIKIYSDTVQNEVAAFMAAKGGAAPSAGAAK